jgi:hypothetical protein
MPWRVSLLLFKGSKDNHRVLHLKKLPKAPMYVLYLRKAVRVARCVRMDD